MSAPKLTTHGLVNDEGEVIGAGAFRQRAPEEALFFHPPRRSASETNSASQSHGRAQGSKFTRKVGYETPATRTSWSLSGVHSEVSDCCTPRQEGRRCVSQSGGHRMKGDQQSSNPLAHFEEVIAHDVKKPYATNADKPGSMEVQHLNNRRELLAFERGSAMTRKLSMSSVISSSDRMRACLQDGFACDQVSVCEDSCQRGLYEYPAGRPSMFIDTGRPSKRVSSACVPGSDASSAADCNEDISRIDAYRMRDAAGAPMLPRGVDCFGIRRGSICSTEASTPRSTVRQEELWSPRGGGHSPRSLTPRSSTPRSSATGATTPAIERLAPRPSSECAWSLTSSEYAARGAHPAQRTPRKTGNKSSSSAASSEASVKGRRGAKDLLAALKACAARDGGVEDWDELSETMSVSSKSSGKVSTKRVKKSTSRVRGKPVCSSIGKSEVRRSQSSAPSYAGEARTPEAVSSRGSNTSNARSGASAPRKAGRRRASSASCVHSDSRTSDASTIRSVARSGASTPRTSSATARASKARCSQPDHKVRSTVTR